jgi:hypothetical protein
MKKAENWDYGVIDGGDHESNAGIKNIYPSKYQKKMPKYRIYYK